MRDLKMRRVTHFHAIDDNQLRTIIEMGLCIITEEAAEEHGLFNNLH